MGAFSIDEVELSPTEKKLTELALNELTQAAQEKKDLTPYVLATMGLTYNEEGKLRNMTSDEFYANLTDEGKRTYDITRQMQERQLRALSGDLPVSEAIEQQKQEEFELTKQSLAERGHYVQGGTLEDAVGLSTPAIQTLGDLKQRFRLAEDIERRDEIARGSSILGNQLGTQSDLQQRGLSNFSVFPQRGSSVLGGVSSVSAPFDSLRQVNNNIQARNAAGIYGLLNEGVGILGRLIP